MRATNLQFRSPKEYTPAPYNIQITKEGRPLQFIRRSTSSLGTFSKETRFNQFRELARRMPAEIGPGRYDYKNGNIEKSMEEKGAITYKKLHQEKMDGDDGAMLVGNMMLYDERLSSYKSTRKNLSPLPMTSRTEETKPSVTAKSLEIPQFIKTQRKFQSQNSKSSERRQIQKSRSYQLSSEISQLLWQSDLRPSLRSRKKSSKRL